MATADSSHLIYRLAARLGVARLLRGIGGGATVFCFHNVVAEGEAGAGDESLHLPVDHFEHLVGWISEAYRVVPLSELSARVQSGRTVGGLASITFDDAYVGTLRHGLPVLEEMGLPATLYVVSDAAEQPEVFWWDELAARGVLSPEVREVHLARHQGLSQRIRGEGTTRAGSNPVMVHESMLPDTWSGIRTSLEGRELFSVGSHTVRHPNLTTLQDRELAEELERSREVIADRLGCVPDSVSYPYGRHDERVRDAARYLGYINGMTLGPGLVRSGTDPLGMPRLNVPASIGRAALECWSVGLSPQSRL